MHACMYLFCVRRPWRPVAAANVNFSCSGNFKSYHVLLVLGTLNQFRFSFCTRCFRFLIFYNFHDSILLQLWFLLEILNFYYTFLALEKLDVHVFFPRDGAHFGNLLRYLLKWDSVSCLRYGRIAQFSHFFWTNLKFCIFL